MMPLEDVAICRLVGQLTRLHKTEAGQSLLQNWSTRTVPGRPRFYTHSEKNSQGSLVPPHAPGHRHLPGFARAWSWPNISQASEEKTRCPTVLPAHKQKPTWRPTTTTE